MKAKLRVLLGTLLFAVPSDQAAKAWVASHLATGVVADRIPLIRGFLYISHERNAGAAFGFMLEWAPQWRLCVFALVFLAAAAVIISFYRHLAPGDRLNALALGLVMGGAIGNFIDRVVRGEVVDFVHVRLWAGRSWPDFNLADAYIVVGVAALMLELLAAEGASRAAPRPGEAEKPPQTDTPGE